MTLHVILSPGRCKVCGAKVVYGWVDGQHGSTASLRRWRDPATGKVHTCPIR